jgi:hypothetical protein
MRRKLLELRRLIFVTAASTFRTLVPTELMFEGNRAVVFDASDTVPTDTLRFCIAAALTYHRDKAAASR